MLLRVNPHVIIVDDVSGSIWLCYVQIALLCVRLGRPHPSWADWKCDVLEYSMFRGLLAAATILRRQCEMGRPTCAAHQSARTDDVMRRLLTRDATRSAVSSLTAHGAYLLAAVLR